MTRQELSLPLEALRLRLLDLSKRNNLLNFRENKRTLRTVDELPNEVFRILVVEEKQMIIEHYTPPENEGSESLLDQIESTNRGDEQRFEIEGDHNDPDPRKYSLSAQQAEFIEGKVEECGSLDKCKARYSNPGALVD